MTRQIQAGTSVDLDAYARDHPEQIGQLRELLPALEVLAGFKAATAESTPALGLDMQDSGPRRG